MEYYLCPKANCFLGIFCYTSRFWPVTDWALQKVIPLASRWKILWHTICAPDFPPRDQMETSLRLMPHSCWDHFAPALPCFPYSPCTVNTPSRIPLYKNSYLRCCFSTAFFMVKKTKLSVKVHASFQSDNKFSYRDGNTFFSINISLFTMYKEK